MEVTLPSAPESISKIEKLVEEICTEYALGDDVFGNMLISVTEAVNNAILHGNQQDNTKNITITHKLAENPKVVSISVSDEGPGFDHNNLPDPTAPENVTMIGGRGVFLIKQLSDWVIFSNNGSTIEMQFKV